MPKNLVIGLVAFVLIVAGAVGYLATRPDDEAASPSQSSTPETVTEANPDQTAVAGRYADYSTDELANASGDIYLFFHASWCPQCRSIEDGIESQGVPEGITILKVDYDSNQALRQKYGVTIQTTFVKVNSNGDFISKYVAYDEPTFDAVKENYL